MRKHVKKALAWLGTAMMTIGLVTVPALSSKAALDVDSLPDGTAYLSINNEEWGDYEADYTTVEITDNGTYTVSMEAKEAQDLAQFNALQVKNGESALGNGCILTVDEIKLNGEAIELQGPSYTCSADGAGIDTRVNLYNEWNTPVDDNGEIASDVRGATNPSEATAMLWTSDQLKGVKSVEVTFTVSDFGVVREVEDDKPVLIAEDGQNPQLALNINNVDWADFERESEPVPFEGEGTYTLEMTMTEPQDLAPFNAVEIENGEIICGSNFALVVKKIVINDEEVELQGDSYTCSADAQGVTTRVNLYNEWNSPVDENGNVGADVRCADGVDPAKTTATLIPADKLTGVKSISVELEVVDTGALHSIGGEEEAEPAATGEVDKDGEYNAYILIQSPLYSFRNAWYDQYGLDYSDDTGMDYFNQITGWDADGNAIVVPGDIHDAKITGNGTYTISIDNLQFADDEFATQDHFNLIAIDTDIPNTGDITISDVELEVNGTGVDIDPIVSEDQGGAEEYLTILIQNIWNEKVAEIGYTPTPVTSVKITFTVSGFNYDNEVVTEEATTEAPASEDKAETKDESKGMSKGLIAGIVAAGVAVVAIITGVIVGGKKKDEDSDKKE